MELYENIKNRRKKLKLSQDELAKLTGYTDRTSISKIESGKVDLPQSKIRLFAQALQTTEGELMGTTSNTLLPNAIPYTPTQRIPILGRISAGLPLYAEENIEGYTWTDLNHGGEYFGLIVKGDSMDALGIKEGYVVIVRRQNYVDNGSVSVVMVGDDEATMKRFYQNGDTVTLMPQSTNPAHMPQIYNLKNTPVRVIGKVIEVKFSL